MKKYLTLLFLIISIMMPFSEALSAQHCDSCIDEIGRYLKRSIDHLDKQDPKRMVQDHFKHLGLLDRHGKWHSPQLQEIGDDLIPPKLKVASFYELIDEMVRCANQNPYLVRAMGEIKSHDLSNLYEKIEKERCQVIPDVIAYAMCLQNLTKAVHNNINLLTVCNQIWEQTSFFQLLKHFSPFELVKYYSIRGLEGILKDCASGEVAYHRFKFGVPLNILEATITDLFSANFDNASAGCSLILNNCDMNSNQSLMTEPTKVVYSNEQGPTIHSFHPLPKKWADLYAAWNSGFVVSFKNFPYFMTKLLIPQVNDYSSLPQEYMFNRAIALWTHANFLLGTRIHNEIDPNIVTQLDWYDETLVKAFGIANAQSAGDYQNQVTHHSKIN